LAQKSGISWVSLIPPMADPAKLLRPPIKLNADTGSGFSGAPTRQIVPLKEVPGLTYVRRVGGGV
jgi:hypothetical protein